MTIEHITRLTASASQTSTKPNAHMLGGDAMGFDDLIDIINPLHHIPIVSQAYRAITGDSISAGSAMIGGGIFGGIAGAITSGASALIEGINGESITTSIAQIATQRDTNTALFSPRRATALQADNGEALLALYEYGAFNAPTKTEPAALSSSDFTKISAYTIHAQDDASRLDPLSLEHGEKTQQLHARLHETMLDTLS